MIVVTVDFNSDEALYMQLCNQIILGIATSQIQEGDSLPSVRQMADDVGINMHTVNKAYTILIICTIFSSIIQLSLISYKFLSEYTGNIS